MFTSLLSKVLLVVKLRILLYAINGIGLGHLNRVLLIAKSVKAIEPKAEIYIITESRFTKLIEDSGFQYCKTPYVSVYKSKYGTFIENESTFLPFKKLMKSVIKRFNPDIIIYDICPFYGILDEGYISNKINVLILRKIKNHILRNLINNGIINKFQLVILPHTIEEFKKYSENIPKEILKSDRFVFTGPIIKKIDRNILNVIKKQYGIKKNKFNVLVTLGGGGGPNVEQIFNLIRQSNFLLKKKIKNLNLIVVKGPYYKRDIYIKNIIVKDFEPNLIELIKSVDLVISTAGYNIYNEICKVKTPAIMFPFIGKTENQLERVNNLEKKGSVICLTEYDAYKLFKMVLNLYRNPKKLNNMKKSFSKIKVDSGNIKAAKEILQLLEKYPRANLKYKFEKYHRSKKVSIVIPTYNRRELLKKTLISLFNQNYPKDKYEIIVVDDGSNDDTEEMIKSLKPTCNFKYFYWPRKEEFKLGEPKNRVAVARNIGIENSEGEIIVFVDSDMILHPNCIREHVKIHEKYDRVVVIGYRYLLFKNNPKNWFELLLKGKSNLTTMDDKRELSYFKCNDDLSKLPDAWTELYSNNASVKKNHLIDVGMFDKNMINKLWGFEDYELGYRLQKNGFKFILNRKAIGYHQYHLPEYVNIHGMMLAKKSNLKYIYEKHQDPMILQKIGSDISYDYELLNLGKKCNNRCTICDFLQRQYTVDKTTIEIKKEMDKICGKSILISGGEPTVRPDIFDIILYAKSLDFNKIALETNGRMFSYKDFCSKIIDAGANQFFVYIHGPTADVHESITNTEGSFEQTLAGIRNLTDAEQIVEAKVCVTTKNYKHLLETFKLLNGCRVKSVQFLIPRMPEEAGVIPKYVKIVKEIKKVFDYAKKERCLTNPIIFFI